MNHIEPGKKYLLDKAIEVVVLKAFNRSHTVYKIEVPGKSVELVDRERLTAIPDEMMKHSFETNGDSTFPSESPSMKSN